jgi:hypothetical protein
LEWSADVRFGAHNGLKSDIAPCRFRASIGHRFHSINLPISETLQTWLVAPPRKKVRLVAEIRDAEAIFQYLKRVIEAMA